MAAFRHIAIGGVSFIGSTALGILLGSLEGFAHIGESRWLTERVDSKLGHSVAIDFAVDPPESWGHHCRVCGRRCPVLNPAFRASLAADPTHWYERIAHHIETDFLVSSDKSPGFYRRLAPESEFDLVILFRTPASFIRSLRQSKVARIEANVTVPKGFADVAPRLGQWVQIYDRLQDIRPRGAQAFLNWEGFAASPAQHFDRLLKILKLPGNPAVFDQLRLGHFIGGNGRAEAGEIVRTKRFIARPSAAPPLSNEETATVLAHEPSQSMFQRLEDQYRRDFGDLSPAPLSYQRDDQMKRIGIVQ